MCGIVILILTGLPGTCFPTVNPEIGLDKVAHLLMYAGFAFATLWGYRASYAEKDKSSRIKALTITFFISIIFGALTEIMQETICYQRYGSIYDFAADAIGTIVGIAVFAFFYKKRK